MEKLTIEQGIDLFSEGYYRESAIVFLSCYNSSEDVSEKKEILSILDKTFYQPNLDVMTANFRQNTEQLNSYKFCYGVKNIDFENLPFKIFPIDESEYIVYNKKQDVFSNLETYETNRETEYFFQDLDKPLFVENQLNFFNLKFLHDNVRRSEDYGEDNHIYVYYDLFEFFAPLLILEYPEEFAKILTDNKIVFLFGKENRSKYLLDFKKEFGIDYSLMKPQPLRIDEMNRICYWWKRGYSGSSLFVACLQCNPYVSAREGYIIGPSGAVLNGNDFYDTYSDKPASALTLDQSEDFINFVKDFETRYTIKDLHDFIYGSVVTFNKKGCDNPQEHIIEWKDLDEFYGWFKERYNETQQFTFPELFRAFFIFAYQKDHPDMNPRISPVILWEPHFNNHTIFEPLALSFPYNMAMNSIREPIQTAARIFELEGSMFIYSDYIMAPHMNKDLRSRYYAARFEDIKLYPEKTCRAICKVWDIPYDEKMLKVDCPETNKGQTVRGFDITPIQRPVDYAFSEFDVVRMKIFYDPILKHYGYPSFDFEECPISKSELIMLLRLPFRFENKYLKGNQRWGKCTKESLRKTLFDNMIHFALNVDKDKIVLPKLISIDNKENENG